ncbi:MAG: hypothetical protein FNT15_08855 [Sulfurovum sp.]|nr:MAG: hypothetical protein FNT15_08855 [Sulfurovum sp.]
MCKIFIIMTLLSLAFLEAKTSKITPRVPKSLMKNGCQMMANGYLLCPKTAPKANAVISLN